MGAISDWPSVQPGELDAQLFIRQADPYALYHSLREHDPIRRFPDGKHWMLTRYADTAAVLRDPRFGYAEKPDGGLPTWRELLAPAGGAPDWPQLDRKGTDLPHHWMILRNPPVHTRLRAAVQAGFSAAAIAAWRPHIQQVADWLLNRARANGQIDLVADFAIPLGSILIASVLGVPLYDRLQIEAWANGLAAVFELGNTPDSVQREKAAIIGLIAYFRDLTDRRAAQPGNDLLGQLIRARNTGELSDDEMLSMCLLLILAGHSTTRNMVGNSVLALMHHPDQWQSLRDAPGLVASAAEECLRYDTSGQRAGRVALADVRLGEVTIEAGQTVFMLLGAANRDPAQFAAPDRFDIRRSPNAHLSFGLGIHHCLGARLGRAVVQVTLSSLARHFPNARLAAEPEIIPTPNLRGLKSLRLEF